MVSMYLIIISGKDTPIKAKEVNRKKPTPLLKTQGRNMSIIIRFVSKS